MTHPIPGIHLDQHHHHASAVVATITGPGTYLAQALLSTRGFRPADTRTMILVRIDHEEPYYTDQVIRALRQEGLTVEVSPGLQEAIDTEWTWANHPMHWLSRDEIRQVSDDAQKIHDDIVSGRLTIHLHANDGWTTVVAVGTYREGQSIHLHGEDHLRVVAGAFETAAQALAEFERLYADAVRPGPAPATDTEREAAELLATTTLTGALAITTTKETPAPEPARPDPVPVYQGDPGDHEALLEEFLESEGEWEKYRTSGDDATVANHESLTLRAEFLHDTQPREVNWTIAAYESPVGARLWHATATASTPVEMMRTFLSSLASGTDSAPLNSPSEGTVAQVIRPLADQGWQQTIKATWIHWTPPNGDTAGVVFDAFTSRWNHPDTSSPTWTVWGGNTPDRPTWAIHLSAHTPASVLQDLTYELADGMSTRQNSTVGPPRPTSSTIDSTRGLPTTPVAPGPGRNR